MSVESGTATTYAARAHARAQDGTRVETMPTVPARAARDLPAGVEADDVVWDETLGAGGYASRVLQRGARLRLTDLEGDACVGLLVYNADSPIERLNVADTVKVQWNAYLGRGGLLLSDMGRVLMSIVEDTCGNHDALCGCSNERVNARRYGTGANHGPCPNARDRFLIALAKHGLGRKDVTTNVNLFKGVRVDADGGTALVQSSSRPGAHVELRAEMNVLVVIANTPHVLDDRSAYTATPVRATAWRGPLTAEDDWVRTATPEGLRAFQNVEEWFAR
jgi:urea carboxylase-associated protein 2